MSQALTVEFVSHAVWMAAKFVASEVLKIREEAPAVTAAFG